MKNRNFTIGLVSLFIMILCLWKISSYEIERLRPEKLIKDFAIEKQLINYNNDVLENEYFYLVSDSTRKGFMMSNKCGQFFFMTSKYNFNLILKGDKINHEWFSYVVGGRRVSEKNYITDSKIQYFLRVNYKIFVLSDYDNKTDHLDIIFNLGLVGDSSMLKHYSIKILKSALI